MDSYLHGGATRWNVQSQKIGNGWNFTHVFAGVGNAIYAMRPENPGDVLETDYGKYDTFMMCVD